MAGELQVMAKTEACIVCGGVVMINPDGYSPPVTNQPIQDTGLWCYQCRGYVCRKCLADHPWNNKMVSIVYRDWGVVVTNEEVMKHE